MLYTFSPRHESIESPEIPEVATCRSHEYVKDTCMASKCLSLGGTIWHYNNDRTRIQEKEIPLHLLIGVTCVSRLFERFH
jgi:hypothetical protein